ncbi:hypothetical protein ACFQH3_20700 [Haladaptatus sp. GCM10025707]|uniref:hypothetical protein n=1 Tax=unclassified Haladaptatus TaxID=2622732 RepID=UPI0023E79BBF|nr:hypothetical protein [Haladaptatus sp. QDMS2]
MSIPTESLTDLLEYPLLQAIFGRRARRFGLGMEIPSGPLAFESDADPHPLSDLEQSVLVAAGTGVTGWSFGLPFGPARPDEHADYTVRFTGRTAPTAAGIGTPVLFYTDDDGTYVTNTRDVNPDRARELNDIDNDAEQIIAVSREQTEQLSDSRLDLPAAPGHILEPNHWWANSPGSTLFMPVADASEQMLGLLSLFVENGYLIADDDVGEPAGDLAPFIRSGLLEEDKVFPLSFLERFTYSSNCAEVAFIGHNIVLTLQAMGLGGLFFTGLSDLSVLGSPTAKGIEGLGFTFVEDEDWTAPNPVGLDGVFEGLCPPYYPNMRAAVEEFVERKFGPEGAYDPRTGGPWKESDKVKQTVSPYSDEMVDCLTEIVQYVYDKHGKFPGTIPTMVLPGYVQAHHLDTKFYDSHYQPGAYLDTHADHMRRWHVEDTLS